MVMSTLSASPWDRPGFIDTCAGLIEEEAQKNPVSDALRCTEEFTKILRSLNSSTSSTAGERATPAVSRAHREGSPDRQYQTSMATVLSILSTYMRILERYDILFSKLHRVLNTIPIGVITSMRIKSVVCICTMPFMQDMPGLAYAQTVLFVIQYHIKALELEMGLPTRFCIALREAPVRGIFTNDNLVPLLQQVMEQPNAGLPKGDMHRVESLRLNIRMTVDLLGGTGSV
jgi:hypothetical protein